MAVLLTALILERWKRKRFGERPPQQDKLLRPPGHSLNLQLSDLADNFAGWMMGAFLASLFAVGLIASGSSNTESGRVVSFTVFGAAAAGCTIMAWRTGREIRFRRLGLLGEQSVAEQLQSLLAEGYRVFHDVPGNGKWNIDHVVVGPAGVFAIETKCKTKRPGKKGERDHEAVFDGKAIHFPWGYDTEALEQARRNATWLANTLSKTTGERVAARPIVALPGWFVTLKANSDVKVLTRIFHREIKQRSGECVQRLESIEPNETAPHRFFCDRL